METKQIQIEILSINMKRKYYLVYMRGQEFIQNVGHIAKVKF